MPMDQDHGLHSWERYLSAARGIAARTCWALRDVGSECSTALSKHQRSWQRDAIYPQ